MSRSTCRVSQRCTLHERGAAKISSEWQEFVVKTYRDSNRGSRLMSRAQVWLRVKARAAEQGTETYPNRTTVYRVLKPYIEKQQQARSIGWRGDRRAATPA